MDARSPTRPGGWAPRELGHLRKWLRERKREWGGLGGVLWGSGWG